MPDPRRAAALSQRAAADGTTLAAQVARTQWLPPSRPGPLMVGDSVTWRGGDELARLLPALTVDGEPARRPTELPARLEAYRHRNGAPTGLVVELGTNPAQGYTPPRPRHGDRRPSVVDAGHARAPYVETSSDPVVLSAWAQRFGGWMRSIAAGRPHTCVADWPAYVRTHPDLLQDGIHPQNVAEGQWAAWVAKQWSDC